MVLLLVSGHKKTPAFFRIQGFVRLPALTYSHMASATLPSAMTRFTSEFGMDSGGSTSLWAPGKRVLHVSMQTHVRNISQCVNGAHVQTKPSNSSCHPPGQKRHFGGYMVKPHGQLVLVSFTRYRASTPSLSTSWSTRVLQ